MATPTFFKGRMIVYILLLLIVLLTMWQIRRCTPSSHNRGKASPTADSVADSVIYHQVIH